MFSSCPHLLEMAVLHAETISGQSSASVIREYPMENSSDGNLGHDDSHGRCICQNKRRSRDEFYRFSSPACRKYVVTMADQSDSSSVDGKGNLGIVCQVVA